MSDDQQHTPSTDETSGAEDTLGTLLQGQIAALEAQLSLITKENEEWKDKTLRAQAEFQNATARHRKEKEDLLRYGTERVMSSLLPVLDTFAQAFQHLPEELANHQWTQGIVQSEKMLQKTLEQFEFKPMDIIPGTTAFDPTHHEAISQEAAEGKSGLILEVFQKGYMLGDKVIRAAKVKVGI